MTYRFAIGLLVVISLGVRVYLATWPGNFDQESYKIVVSIMERGGNIYQETKRYNYAPIWAFVLLYLSYLSSIVAIPFTSAVRLFLIAIDLVNAYLIGAIHKRRAFAIAYLLNPISILIVGYHGQFETLAALPLLSVVLLTQRAKVSSNTAIIWLLATISLAIKHILLFHVWALLYFVTSGKNGKLKATILMTLALSVWLLSFVLYIPEGLPGIIQNVILYRGVPKMYGISAILPAEVGIVLFFIIMIALPVLLSNRSIQALLESCSVIMLTCIPGIGIHYLLLPILFGRVSAGYWWYTAWATLLILASPNNVGVLPIPPLWNYAWIGALGWAVMLFKPAGLQLGPQRGDSPAAPDQRRDEDMEFLRRADT